MMTEYRAQMRSRLGPKIAAGLDGLTPLFAQGQARRAVGGLTSQDTAAGSVAAAQVFGPQSSGAQSARSVEQSALLVPRRSLATRVDDHATPAAKTSYVHQTGLRLVADRDRPEVTVRDVNSDSRTVTPIHPSHVANDVSDHAKSATDDGQDIGLGPRSSQPVSEAASLMFAQTKTAESHDPMVADQAGAGAQTPKLSRGEIPDIKAPQGRSVDLSAQSVSEKADGQAIVDMLQHAAARRAVPMDLALAGTVNFFDVGAAREHVLRPIQQQFAPLKPLTSQSASTSLDQKRALHPENPMATVPFSGRPTQTSTSISPIAQLDQYLPKRDMRPNKPLAEQSQSGSTARDEDTFAFDLRIQAALSRLLQSDMRRHGLHPHGEVL